jgi:hypothetical protein
MPRSPVALLDQIVREHALVIGGLFARRQISEEVTWQLVHALRASRIRALRSSGESEKASSLRHPAVAQLLEDLRRR